jgi:hypothetical protein
MRKAPRELLRRLLAVGSFDGLTTDQACELLYRGLGNREPLVILNEAIDPRPLKAIRLYNDISYYLSIIRTRQPVRLTQLGNLGRALSRELRDAGLYEDAGASAILRRVPLRSELDAPYLHYINALTQLAGYTRRAGRKLILTDRGEDFLAGGNASGDFTHLFRTHAGGLNWAYLDSLPEHLFIQEGLLFSLYLVKRYGEEPREAGFYFLKYSSAFPYVGISTEVPSGAWNSDIVEFTYFRRTFESFLARFGLVEVKRGGSRLPLAATIRKTDLFDRFIRLSDALDVAEPGQVTEANAGGPTPRDEFPLVYQFKIALKGVRPPVWRRIQVPSNYSFWDLHVAIADAMGWADYHLHMFRMRHPSAGNMVYVAPPDDDFPPTAQTFEETDERIDLWFSPGNPTATYEYDFGDGWEHTVRLEKILPRAKDAIYPALVKGKRACPPEDVGGPPGYERFLEIIKDPSHPDHNMMMEWSGEGFDPEYFDPDDVEFDDPRERWERTSQGLP